VRELQRLQDLAGPKAGFRTHQLEAIRDLVDDRARVLCVQRTGWGKSAVYFIAAALLREQGAGPALIVSPLLALMRNQIAAAERLGLRAHTVNSTNRDAWHEVKALLADDAVDLLLISPERLDNPTFRAEMLPLFADRVGLVVIDEAHCISDWGHDFRPDYRRLKEMLERLPTGVAVLCTTATANDRVVADIEDQLRVGAAGLRTYRGPLGRASLRFEVVELPGQADRLAWLATWLPQLPGSGIVYTLTKRDAELVAEWLTARGIRSEAYSGEIESDRRVDVEERLLANELKAVVATSALGMGYDKPDLGFVVHYQAPGSVIAYYQQVGRAGRALEHAEVVLLRGHEDRRIQDFFIQQAFPPRELVDRVMERLDGDGATARELMAHVNLGRGRVDALLKVLDVEGAVTRDGSRWSRVAGSDWRYDGARYARVTALRRREQEAMAAFGADGRCLMRALQEELDDPEPEDCGRCAACAGARYDARSPPRSSARPRSWCGHARSSSRPRRWRPTRPGRCARSRTTCAPRRAARWRGSATAAGTRSSRPAGAPAASAASSSAPRPRRCGRGPFPSAGSPPCPRAAPATWCRTSRAGSRTPSACRSRRRSSASATRRRSARWRTPRSRSPTCAASSRSPPTSRPAPACSWTTSASAAGRSR